MKKYLAELIGTFVLVFGSTGLIILDGQTGGSIGDFGTSINCGLMVTAMIYAFGRISGAHLNPAVSISLAAVGLFDKSKIAPYIVSQLCGAFMASLLLRSIFPTDVNLGANHPSINLLPSFMLETALGFILMLVILYTSQGKANLQKMAGVIIGATVALEIIFAGNISGASMNPVRSIAPAVVSGNITSLWIYILAPVIGAYIAAIYWKHFGRNKTAANVETRNAVIEKADVIV